MEFAGEDWSRGSVVPLVLGQQIPCTPPPSARRSRVAGRLLEGAAGQLSPSPARNSANSSLLTPHHGENTSIPFIPHTYYFTTAQS